jgi:hypothetical protein
MAQPVSPQRPSGFNPANVAGYDNAVRAALLDTGVPGLKEVLDYTFYDSASIATGATSTSALFQSASTNIANSNFVGNGQMPSGQAFLVRSLRFIPAIGTAGADVVAAMKGFQVQFLLENSKKYFDGLAQFLPAGIGATLEYIAGTTAPLSTGISHGNAGVPVLGNIYRFTRPVVLHTLQPFTVNLIALNPTLVATTRFYVAMDGVYVRNVV